MSRFAMFQLATLVPVMLLLACAEPRPAVNRVQPGAIHRSVFEGEWYFQQTVIDTPYGTGFTFVGEQGGLSRIRWEIQEDFLVARRAYEWIAGSEREGIAGPSSEQGAAIAMYRIESHFDIRREYNPTTGEELNVLGENSSDRPWYERDYVRVDWSENLIADADMFAIDRYLGGIQMEPAAYDIEDPNHPDAPRFETLVEGEWQSVGGSDGVAGTVQYIDIVNKLFARPESAAVSGGGQVPVCYLLYTSHLDCAPAEVTLRNSFLRVDARDADYQPFNYTGDRMDRFGFFVSERPGYDDDYGVVEPARYRFASRHNLWRESHRRDESGNLVFCGANTDCSAVPGSTCDLDYGRARRLQAENGRLAGACTIPYRERELRPVIYYTSSNFPDELDPDAQFMADQWNEAFVDTIGSLRENECLAAGGNASSCAGERTRSAAQRAFYLCHSPVREGEPEACGSVGTTARIGDIRYSLLGWVSDPHQSSPLGYGPSAADPLTGEIIAGTAFIYGAGVEILASRARDIVALLNDDLDQSALTSGESVTDWVQERRAPGSNSVARERDQHVIHLDGFDAEEIDSTMDFSWAELDRPAPAQFSGSGADFQQALRDASERLARSGVLGHGDSTPDLRALAGTSIERLLTTPAMRMAAGLDPDAPLDEAALERASPLRGMSMREQRALESARNRMRADDCILDAEFVDVGLQGLAQAIADAVREGGSGTVEWYGRSYPVGAGGNIDYDQVRAMVMHPIFNALAAHEVGHTLGLRHNFSGSFDALNYNNRYWQLRSDGQMLPRAWDPLTSAEISGRIEEYAYSSVMDYGVNFVVTDAHGIGHYDRAAIKMGYGDMVEVFTNAANSSEVAWTGFIQSLGFPVNLSSSFFTANRPEAHPYTDWPALVGGVEQLEERADVPYTSLVADNQLRSNPRLGVSDPLVDAQQRPVVPYIFCSDEESDLRPSCLRYDAGADPYETNQSIIDSHWNYYVLNNYRRGRLGFSPSGVYSRARQDFSKLQRTMQLYILQRSLLFQFGVASVDPFWTSPQGMGAWTVGVGSGFSFLQQVMTAPEPGDYLPLTNPDGSAELAYVGGAGSGGANAVSINAFDGRFLETSWNFDAGYFWFDQIERAGYFYDKVAALETLVDSSTQFLGQDTEPDSRRYLISYGTAFRTPLTALLSGTLTNSPDIAPRVNGRGEPVYPSPTELIEGNVGGTPLDPNISFSLQAYAATYGMVFIPQSYDQSYLNKSRIWAAGATEAIDIPANRLIEFTDDESGITYQAVSFIEEGRETGVGARMLTHARELATQGRLSELSRYVDNIDLVRQLTWLLGAGAQR